VTFEFSFGFARLDVEYLYGSIFVTNYNFCSAFVKDSTIGGAKATVELLLLFNHSDVPDFVDSIAITRYNMFSISTELYSVDSIIMSVEGLDTKVGSNIPQRNSFITSSGNKHGGVRAPLDGVYTINVTSEGESTSIW